MIATAFAPITDHMKGFTVCSVKPVVRAYWIVYHHENATTRAVEQTRSIKYFLSWPVAFSQTALAADLSSFPACQPAAGPGPVRCVSSPWQSTPFLVETVGYVQDCQDHYDLNHIGNSHCLCL
jgi:hypothetical protein